MCNGKSLRSRASKVAAAAALALGVALGGQDAAAQVAVGAAGPPPLTRELAVATFDTAWTWIARSHYDSLFNGVDWDAVRTELRPRAERAATMDELRGVVSTMLARLGESHYVLIPGQVADAIEPGDVEPEAGAPGDVGLEVRLAGGGLVVWRVDADGPAAAAGIRTGWILDAIDGQPAAAGVDGVEALDGIERQRALTRFLMRTNQRLTGAAGSRVALKLRDGADRTVESTLVRRDTPGQSIQLGNLPAMIARVESARLAVDDGCVGVVRWNVWMVPVAPQIDRAIDASRDCRGIVLDLRGNPGGVAGMLIGVAGHFFAEPTTLGRLRSRTADLRFNANPRRVAPDGRPVQPYDGPVAILQDALSVSTSELFAGGMQATGRARIFGETSAGQALPAVASRLPNHDVLMYVVADATGPGGERFEGTGVRPDQDVPLRREDLLAGRDAALDAAIDWILRQRVGTVPRSKERP